MLTDDWFTVQRIDADTYAISEYGHWEKVHSFLLIGEKKAVLIDTGLGIDDIKRITDQLTGLPIYVVTTHVHTDHIGCHSAFEHIYVHKADQRWLVKGIEGLSIEQVRKGIRKDITKPVPPSFDPETYEPFTGEPTGLLEDGDVMDLGNRKLHIIHTPGHSPGHISIFDETNGYLFTGDILYDETPVYAFYPSTDPEALLESWEKIAALKGVKKVFGSHNSVGLDPEILLEAKNAAIFLREHDLAKFGTGVHEFNGFSVKF
ncbi:MBL fold metallo-hydrolase [Jeotgalibacillus malaysiensis]|uniref:MBL fold metallo-hydrolase n=1 Tax=Jeotgalibacillus malaysiensis TaxID=1508404 RepID=UPI00384C1C0F